jgi:stearoyl-CoA desaturase (Delta-9 desaturase)
MGEGWHNNHHHYQSSARQGFMWWEIDMSYYILRMLAFVGLVWDIREPTEKALVGNLAGAKEGDESRPEEPKPEPDAPPAP